MSLTSQDAQLDSNTPVSNPFSALFSILSSFPGKHGVGDWSSAIGIITAIIGNILISLALNTQRYAHIRLDKEYLEREKHQLRSRGDTEAESYGAIGGNTSDTQGDKSGRRKLGRQANGRRSLNDIHDEDQYDEDAQESDPLLPQANSPGSSTTQIPEEVEDDDKDAPVRKKNYLKSPWWWLGITLMVIGEAGNFLAYGFAPASIVSPLGVVALISNCLIAPIMLRERFRWRDALGVLISIGGAVTIVTSAAGSNPKLGPGMIWDLIRRWQFETYLGITFGAIVVLMFLSNYYGDKFIVIDLGLVGLFGGYTALSTKGVASLISFRLWNVVKYPVFYLLVAVLVITAIMQIKYVNRALQHFDSTQVIPTQFVMFTIFVIVGSAILYQDFEKKGAGTIGQFIGGCLLTFLGVWCLTGGRGRKKDDEEETYYEEAQDEEQAIIMTDEEDDAVEQGTTPHTPYQNRRPAAKLASGLLSTYEDSPASFATANTNFPDPLEGTSSSTPYIHATISSPVLSRDGNVGDDPFETPTSTQTSKLAPLAFQAPSTSPARPRVQQLASDSNLQVPAENTPRPRLATPQHDPSQRYSVPNPDISASSSPLLGRSHTVHSMRNSPRVLPGSLPGGGSPFLRAPTRQSITSGMIPGPLTRPLAGGFTSVVADSRRREERRASERARRDSLTKLGTPRARGNSIADNGTVTGTSVSRSKGPRRSAQEATADLSAAETVPAAGAERVSQGNKEVNARPSP